MSLSYVNRVRLCALLDETVRERKQDRRSDLATWMRQWAIELIRWWRYRVRQLDQAG